MRLLAARAFGCRQASGSHRTLHTARHGPPCARPRHAPKPLNPATPPLQVESIVLSIISMLSSPNDESPANVDAAKMWRESRDEFKKKVSRIVRRSQESL